MNSAFPFYKGCTSTGCTMTKTCIGLEKNTKETDTALAA
jgi:hypothetical protein